MNTEKVKALVTKIAEKARLEMRYTNKPTQKALRQIEELGLTDIMGRRYLSYAACVNAVLEAAEFSGRSYIDGGGTPIDGDGDSFMVNEPPSDLYRALQESETDDALAILRDMVAARNADADIENDDQGFVNEAIPVNLASRAGKTKAARQRKELLAGIKRGRQARKMYIVYDETEPLGLVSTAESLASLTTDDARFGRQRTYHLYRRR